MLERKEKYRGYRTAGIRLREEVAPELAEVAYPGPPERAKPILKGVHMFDKAHTVMLAEESIIPKDAAKKILKGLKEIDDIGVEKARMEVGFGIHSGEVYLTKKLGMDVAGYIHTGRSSGDLGAVSRRIFLRERVLEVMAEVIRVRETLLKLAEEHVETVMPGYTHLQHAQPFTLAHYLCAKLFQLERDFQRLMGLYKRLNISPAGAAIFTGSDFPLNRKRTMELLGFDEMYENTLDAILHHDYMQEAAMVLAILNNTLCKISEDFTIWCSNEFGIIELADRWCGTSSIMPQKKNPYALEHIRGVASVTCARALGWLIVEKESTGTAILDRNLVMDDLVRSIKDTLGNLKLTTGVISTLKVDVALMRARAGAFWSQATDLAGVLVREKGLPWRIAHQITGILVRKSYEKGIIPTNVTSEFLDEAAAEYINKPLKLSDEALKKALDPVECVKSRRVVGGPAPERVNEQIKKGCEELDRDKEALLTLNTKLKKASEKLEKAINSIINT